MVASKPLVSDQKFQLHFIFIDLEVKIFGKYLKITAIVSIARAFGKSYFELIE